MKLSTLLLSSAAIIVAGSAFAADLPAKKGAPAAKAATGCPAFGAGFFQIPGGDNCIKFSGAVYADTVFGGGSNGSVTGSYDLYVDVRSNTDGGVLRGFAGMSGGSLVDKAYVQYAGLSAGHQDALTKVYGAGGVQGGAAYSNPSDSIYYSIPAGSATISVGFQNPGSHTIADDTTQDVTSNNPDIAARISTTVGGATIKVAGVSHQASDQVTNTQSAGYAGLASLAFDAGGFSVLGFGGYANGATSYIIGDISDADTPAYYAERSNDTNLNGSAFGVQGSVKMGAMTLSAMYTSAGINGYNTVDSVNQSLTISQTNVWVDYAAAKGLTVTPEFLQATVDDAGSKSTSNTMYLRIKRDF